MPGNIENLSDTQKLLVYDQLNEGPLALAHVEKAVTLFERDSSDSNIAAARSLHQKLISKYPDSGSEPQKK